MATTKIKKLFFNFTPLTKQLVNFLLEIIYVKRFRDKIIRPESTYLVTGDVGTGKSGLCYWLMERYAQKYDLQPCVVGLPKDKANLVPLNYAVLEKPQDLTKRERAIALVDEAGIQLPLDDTKIREVVTNFLALPRQRSQIILLCYHIPRLVLSRYLPFFSAFLLKRPPYLYEFASKGKNDTLIKMMGKAEERFAELVPPDWDAATGLPEAVVKQTYVVSPRLRWQGLLPNPLPTYWTPELSKIWAGTEVKGLKNNKVEKTVEIKAPVEQVAQHLIMEFTEEQLHHALSQFTSTITDDMLKRMQVFLTYPREKLQDMLAKRIAAEILKVNPRTLYRFTKKVNSN